MVTIEGHQRMPAPRLRAMVASNEMAMVKRARFAFTFYSSVPAALAIPATGRPPRGGRSLALRPRLAAGLPWTVLRTRNEGSYQDRTGPIGQQP